MKLMNNAQAMNVLPNAATVCEIILRLERPFQVMAWLMVETAARMSDLQRLRVNEVNRDLKTVVFSDGGRVRTMPLSCGLVEAVDAYLPALREAFEKNKRWNRRSREVRMFADQLLFPAWMLDGFSQASLEEPVPAAEFVRALQFAAVASGYEGRVQSNTLRLFCASRWLEQGMDSGSLHAKLGHGDMMTTLLMVQALKYGGLTFVSMSDPDHARLPPAPMVA